MPAKFAALLYPAFLLALAARGSRSPAARFARAQAFSPETSRRPASLGLGALAPIGDLVRSGVLVAVGDGRYYLDRERYRRTRTRTLAGAAVALAVPFLFAGWILWSRGML